MASRCCFGSLPAHFQDLRQGSPRLGPQNHEAHLFNVGELEELRQGGPRLGPQNRAGCLFTVGELEPTVDMPTTGRHGGFRSPRPEARAVTIDCHEARRSTSAPPKSSGTRAAQLQSMQSFGILPDIDGGWGGRRQCPELPAEAPTRQESAKRAMRFRDIEGVMSKRHLSPQHSPSPNAKMDMQTIDIDAPGGLRQTPAKSPSAGILPWDSPSYSLTCPADYNRSPRSSPRVKSYNYFEQSLSAERYAKLIGRPHSVTDKPKGLCRMNLALELERREKFNPASLYDMEGPGGKGNHEPLSTASTTASGCSTPSLSSLALASVPANNLAITAQLENLDSVSVRNSSKAAALRFDLEDQKLSALHKRALAEGANEDELAIVIDSDNQKEAYIQLIVDKFDEKLRKQPAVMPLALRRVVASLIPNDVQIPEGLACDLRTAFRASALSIQKSQGLRRNRSPAPRYTSKRSPNCRSPR